MMSELKDACVKCSQTSDLLEVEVDGCKMLLCDWCRADSEGLSEWAQTENAKLNKLQQPRYDSSPRSNIGLPIRAILSLNQISGIVDTLIEEFPFLVFESHQIISGERMLQFSFSIPQAPEVLANISKSFRATVNSTVNKT